MRVALVSLPVSYYLGVQQETLWGLWAGYGASGLTLLIVYLSLLYRLDWKAVAA
jgi:Na+-driven multidrug efflux pump